ncbi:MAG: hypothetical protein LBI84_09685 [Propionibacteriaceae bacterium]|jgi:hypothetical protein|nr:hypothetical protein [Propionibacteriaceae bacterium]
MTSFAAAPLSHRRQTAEDAVFALWTAVCAVCAVGSHWLFRRFATSAQQMADAAGLAAQQLSESSAQLGQTPIVGVYVAEPLDAMAAGYGETAAMAGQLAAFLGAASWLAPIVCFGAAVGLALAAWLPRRLRRTQAAVGRQALAQAAAGLFTGGGRSLLPQQNLSKAAWEMELYALRALVQAPADKLAQISPDPLAAWQAGDPMATRALAAWTLSHWPGAAAPPQSV